MATRHQNSRILEVTSEVTFARQGMGPAARSISARAAGLDGICAAMIQALCGHCLDVRLVMPTYRNVFTTNAHHLPGIDIRHRPYELPENHIHLAQERSFYYLPKLFRTTDWQNIHIGHDFQLEVINLIIMEVQTDLIHCNDWITAMFPTIARPQFCPHPVSDVEQRDTHTSKVFLAGDYAYKIKTG